MQLVLAAVPLREGTNFNMLKDKEGVDVKEGVN